MDSKLVLVITQTDAALHIESLFENHTAIIFLTDFHLLVEEHKAAEHRFLLRVAITELCGADYVKTILSSNEQITAAATEDGTLVERSRLETVTVVEIADDKRPRTVVLFLRCDIRHTMISGNPDAVANVLGY